MLLLVAEGIGDITGDVIVVMNDEPDRLNSGWTVIVLVLYTVGAGVGEGGGAESASQYAMNC